MKKKITIIVIVIGLLGGGIAAFFYWQYIQSKPEPQPVQVPPVVYVPAEPKPAPQQIIVLPPDQPKLPMLSQSDKFMLDALSGLINQESLIKLFHAEHIIRKIVATIDNLPRKHMPASMVPVKRVPAPFMVEGPEDNNIISPKNAARYSVYVNIAEAIDAQKLVDVYVLLYPLFQQAYVELGYPDKYFNDRLLATIDNLLAAPDLKDPIRLVRPNVFYLYAHSDLEACSAGQKILMRMGDKNATKIKSKLREIKRQVMLHMHEKKVDVTQ